MVKMFWIVFLSHVKEKKAKKQKDRQKLKVFTTTGSDVIIKGLFLFKSDKTLSRHHILSMPALFHHG